MVSKKEYEQALKVVVQYEKEQIENIAKLDKAKEEFPLGSFVVSKLNTAVRGIVVEYVMWSEYPQLILDNKGHKNKCLAKNAEIIQ